MTPDVPMGRAGHPPGSPQGFTPRRRAGRGLGPLALVVPLLAASLWILHRLENPPGRDEVVIGEPVDVEPPARPAHDAPVRGWRGEAQIDGVALVLELAPLVADPVTREFQEARLRGRLGLPAGRGWRLRVQSQGGALGWDDVRVAIAPDEQASPLLAPLLERAAPPADAGASDPLRALYAAPVRVLPGGSVDVPLWGPAPPADAEPTVLLTLAGRTEACALASAELAPDTFSETLARRGPSASTASSRSAATPGASTAAPVDDLAAEVERLRSELQAERARRRDRELEWWEYNRALAQLDLESLLAPFPQDPSEVGLEAGVPAPPEEAAVQVETEPVQARAAEIARSMRALLRVEGVGGFEPLQLGSLQAGAVGPVVMRLLDDRGRLSGSLYAERLRLEASRAAHTLTLVLEEGYESHLGRRESFADGVRRLTLAHVDPAPWIEAMPELFGARDRQPPADDGRWSLSDVRRELNDLLALDVATGWHRVSGFEGVSGTSLVDVHLDTFDAAGRLERRYFADRLRIDVQEDGVLLLLEGGAMVRGDEQKSFLGGTYRLYLPNAPVARWRAALLPGIAPPPGAAPGEGGAADTAATEPPARED